MSVSLLASNVECLGVVTSFSPATINFTPTTAATFVVVAVGWSSASTLTPPAVTINGAAMTQIASPVEWDSASGAVVIYTAPVSSLSGAVPIVVQPSDYLGNTQIGMFAYDGTSLGLVVADEYGTNSAGVDTGTTSLGTVPSGSLTTFCGMTFFGGTPAGFTVNSGWTGGSGGLVATASNEGVYGFYSTDSGALSITITASPDSFFNMLAMGWEVQATYIVGSQTIAEAITANPTPTVKGLQTIAEAITANPTPAVKTGQVLMEVIFAYTSPDNLQCFYMA
jgi:hypothetical protein